MGAGKGQKSRVQTVALSSPIKLPQSLRVLNKKRPAPGDLLLVLKPSNCSPVFTLSTRFAKANKYAVVEREINSDQFNCSIMLNGFKQQITLSTDDMMILGPSSPRVFSRGEEIVFMERHAWGEPSDQHLQIARVKNMVLALGENPREFAARKIEDKVRKYDLSFDNGQILFNIPETLILPIEVLRENIASIKGLVF